MTRLRASTFKDALRRAKARLSDMQTQEVSLVDAAANLRRYVIVKRDEGIMSEQNNRTVKVALRLPTEAKQGIMDGLGQALDKWTALASMVGEAEADDAATVPTDLGMALSQCGDLVKGLAEQYAPAPAEAGEEAPPSDAPPPDGDQAPPDVGKAAPEDEAKKSLPAPVRNGDNMTPQHDSLTMQPKMAALAGELMKAFGDEIVAAAKAGRKIAGSRYKKLSELHNTLGTLLNELAYDEANEKAEEKAARSSARKDAPVTKGTDGSNPLLGKIDELLNQSKSNAERIAATEAAIAKINRTPDVPRGRQVEGGGAPPSAFQWPADLSAALAEQKKATR